MSRAALTFLCCLLLCPPGASAGSGPPEELAFIEYLMARGELSESLFLLERLPPQPKAREDSVSFLKGWVLYLQKELEPSARHLLAVSSESPLHTRSVFFGAYNLAHLGRPRQAMAILGSQPFESGSQPDRLRGFQLAGMALLDRDFDLFARQAQALEGTGHLMQEQALRLKEYHGRLLSERGRSPLLAGLLSAAVPGLGKVYAGKPAEGVAGFLYLAVMGATTWDFYRGAGPRSALFILSASVTGIFYLGNIAGSATAVRRQNKEFNHEMDQRILFDLHIPLRNAFN